MNQKIAFGNDSVSELSDFLAEMKPKSILFLHGKTSYITSGQRDVISPILKKYFYVDWDEFSTNPQYNDVVNGVQITSRHRPDVIVAAGGGSVIDMAKLVGIFCQNTDRLLSLPLSTTHFDFDSIPIVAIPSTAGTGSESTHFAVMWRGDKKYSIASDSLLPVLSIIAPQFLLSQPAMLEASSSIDALSQAIESYWSVNSTSESQSFAEEAIRLIVPLICEKNKTIAMLGKMGIGANFAGRAINITKTTAPHAISYPITYRYKIQHGHAVALTLPSIFEFNSDVTDEDCTDTRGVNYVRSTMNNLARILGGSTCSDACRILVGIIDNLGLERNLSNLGITEEGLDYIVDNGFNEQRVNNNPRRLTKTALRGILNVLRHRV